MRSHLIALHQQELERAQSRSQGRRLRADVTRFEAFFISLIVTIGYGLLRRTSTNVEMSCQNLDLEAETLQSSLCGIAYLHSPCQVRSLFLRSRRIGCRCEKRATRTFECAPH
jgi:hypothetical protein